MIWLEYARQKSGRLVHINEVARGKSGLSCPYCGKEVLARQGHELSWHFAHVGDTCALARNKTRFKIPLYDDFFLGLSPKEVGALQYVHERGWVGIGGYAGERLLISFTNRWLVGWNPYWGRRHTGRHEVTKLGKIPLGILSLPLFAEIQAEKFKEFEEINNDDSPDSEIIRAHLRMLRRAWLYFLRVKIPEMPLLHKIGMTARGVDDRLAEIRADLTTHYPGTTVELLETWSNMGRVERYARFRFRANQHRLGSRTEYFAFEDVKPVLRELRRLQKMYD